MPGLMRLPNRRESAMLSANSYLADDDRAGLQGEARIYAIAQGWAAEYVETFPQYHTNRNEAFRQSVVMSAQQFRIVKDF
jgi:hypothetical protein